MNRRHAVKNIMIASGSIISLPFWMQACNLSSTHTHASSFSPEEQSLLASVTDTIIPPGNAIGALAVGVDKFLQKMLDDCYEQPVRDNVKQQLKALETSAKKTFGQPFEKATQQQRQSLLLKLQTSAAKEEKDFFELVKSETIRGFTTSQQVMEGYLHYKVAPGHYYGCVTIKS
ncbi:gluconate 2-dehydrogenase subunit 3 family protein [Foetidibacter luteolus]|uniref:gluconate 2-dehydrogenase subunit 3 family protein n=1 Tax=Foetidibacter luteolus TaxID=2608880 RepID=UPI00129AA634|nr:gluconate 2-dehydrogenase subunit 3 family protein [Foetidibacter luteolus]